MPQAIRHSNFGKHKGAAIIELRLYSSMLETSVFSVFLLIEQFLLKNYIISLVIFKKTFIFAAVFHLLGTNGRLLTKFTIRYSWHPCRTTAKDLVLGQWYGINQWEMMDTTIFEEAFIMRFVSWPLEIWQFHIQSRNIATIDAHGWFIGLPIRHHW